jgi:hypothetical protein
MALHYTYAELRQLSGCKKTELIFTDLVELIRLAVTQCERYQARRQFTYAHRAIARVLATRVPARVVTLPNGAAIYLVNGKKFHKALADILPRYRTGFRKAVVLWSGLPPEAPAVPGAIDLPDDVLDGLLTAFPEIEGETALFPR